MLNEVKGNVEAIIDQRLSELTPKLVKEIVQKMIKEHLGWLVVWGGVFGGLLVFCPHFLSSTCRVDNYYAGASVIFAGFFVSYSI